MHNRTAIRNAVVALLTTGVTSAAVASERRNRIDSTIRPLCIVALGDDAYSADEMAMGQPAYDVEHAQTVTIEIHVDAATGAECAEEIDQIELEVEAALASDLELGGLVENIVPAGSEMETSTDQDRVIAVRSVAYVAPWRCTFGAPDTPES